ncbi:MAG: GNAT family N-acetyltransferase [Solirubrobacteraceae bacterium]|nr:GNAT family N-acetyltransferase [Solirubrobacteraceae bacterium]
MLRPATAADRADLVALVIAEDAAWSSGPTPSAEEAAEYVDQCAPGMVFERDGRVAGYAAVGEGGDAILLADPDVDPGPALEPLVAWLREQGQDELDTYAADEKRIAWFEAHGFAHRRSVFDLHRGVAPSLPPPAWPDGISLAPYRAGTDDAGAYDLIYVDAAWDEVPGHNHRPLDAWLAMFTPEYDGWIARRGEQPVGWISGRLFEDRRGWIQQLAVARSERGRGLGRALLLHALGALCEQGATSLALGVQGENDGAVRLYRDVGFAVTCEWRVYAAPQR